MRGTYTGAPTAIEARWNNGAWTTVDAAPANGQFSGTLTGQSQGQGTLEVRMANFPGVTKSADYVGVGDIYVIAGQSNGSGRGTNNQAFSGTVKASLFKNNYHWDIMADPSDSKVGQVDTVSSDAVTPAGSVWPLVATSLVAGGIPVAFVPCAMGNTGIVAHQPGASHQDRTTLYGSLVYRALQVRGVKGVLFWEGENDASTGMTQATYNSNLDAYADALFADLGVKTMACKLQHTQYVGETAINAAIVEAWGNNAHVLQGPDLSGIDTTGGDGVHIKSDADLATAASLWTAKIQAAAW